MRINGKLSRIICLVLVVAMAVALAFTLTTSAADGSTTFELGANGDASHYDGSSNTSYNETVGDYTLDITDGSSFYTGARDATGNSCFKLGTGSKTASFTINVPDDVTSVVIHVAGYKTTAASLTINGTSSTTTKFSNNGEYDEITVDTTETKTVTVATTSDGKRAMINSIVFVVGSGSSEPACEHANQTTTTVEASCTEDGSITVTCDDCGETISEEVIEAGHDYVDGFCTVCGEKEPSIAYVSLTFDADKANRTSYSTTQQVWSENGITFTNDKASSSTPVADYGNPVRLYASSSITIAMADGSKIVKIDFLCNNTTYSTNLANSISGATVSGTTVTVELDSVENYTVTLGAQVRLNSLTVYYEVNEAQAECTHVNTKTDTTPATCTTAGRIVV